MADQRKKREAARDSLPAIVEAFAQAQRNGLPKVAQLYDAISNLIASGDIEDGAKLPGERELCSALNISLGTAQKSLGLLMNDGEVVREHGRGTFARAGRRALRELWHYRFREVNSRELLQVYATLVDRALIQRDAEVADALGIDTKGYIRVRRLIDIGDRFNCWSEMYFSATRFERLLKLKITDLESVNLKQLLNDEFNAPTLAVHQTAVLNVPARDICKRVAVSNRTACLLLRIVATSRKRDPISFQRIYVPPVPYEMELSETPFEVAKSLAA